MDNIQLTFGVNGWRIPICRDDGVSNFPSARLYFRGTLHVEQEKIGVIFFNVKNKNMLRAVIRSKHSIEFDCDYIHLVLGLLHDDYSLYNNAMEFTKIISSIPSKLYLVTHESLKGGKDDVEIL